MPSGYSGELSQRQCGIQLSRINLGESRVLKNAFSRISREPKIPNFGNHGTTPQIYWVYYKPPVLSYSEVGAYKEEQRKSKEKQNQVKLKLTTRSIARFSPQTMQWYH